MPKSLRLIKELSQHSINFESVKDLHYFDLMSIIYSLRIDDAINHLKSQARENMQRKGIKNVTDVEGSNILKYLQ